jgi:uncharacterized protein YoxC
MDTLIHADIFFFISTIALVIISIGIVISLVYVIRILRNVSEVSDKVKEESTEILSDVKELRGTIKKEGFKMKHAVKFMKGLFTKKHR